MTKYYVIATRWSDDVKAQIKVVVGEFSEWRMARLFRDAYNENYKSDAFISEVKEDNTNE